MADRRRTVRQSYATNGLVASAQIINSPNALRVPIQNKSWQREAWDFYHAQGEFWYGIEWLSSAMSRVRLRAAVIRPGQPEPEFLDSGPAVDAVARLGGGPSGQAAMLKSLTVKLSVPGEGYIVGENIADFETWSTKSTDELRRRKFEERNPAPRSRFAQPPKREAEFEVQIEENAWRTLSPDSIVCRVWRPDEQYSWKAMSAALPALPILRELDLYNRRIITDLVSRLASNGILIIPDEVIFPVRTEFKDATDPFIAELIDIASKSIGNPGSAGAAIPIPIRVPAEYADKFQHISFASLFDPKLLDARTNALKRLATTLNIPMEVLMGIGEVNHWTAWQIDDSGIKIHITPLAELISAGVTESYLRPMLMTMGTSALPKNGERWVVWPDTTELSSPPDLTEAADAAYDRLEISGAAYRREKGFAEEDKPKDDELKDMALKLMVAKNFNLQALTELTGLELTPPPPLGVDEQGKVVPGGPLDPNLKKEDPKKSSEDKTGPPVQGVPRPTPSGRTTLSSNDLYEHTKAMV